MLTRIRNAQAVRKERVFVPFSKVKMRIATILSQAGYVDTIERRKRKGPKSEHEFLDIGLKYEGDLGAISGLRLVSKPSRRMYTSAKNIKPVRSGYGLSVVSTPKGIMTSRQARKENVGGEIMFEIW
jgi:small subunit ribosomal protein S8